ncbi:MAG: hypothetical protein ACXVCP_05185 [Bdellovibrio sp.]
MKLRIALKHLYNIFTAHNFLPGKFLILFLLVLNFFPVLALAQSPCSIVKILSGKQINEHKFTQQGVGWVYGWSDQNSKGGDLNVVMPAHVVFEANKVFAECNGEMAELFLRGISPSYDLAVLGFVKPEVEKKNFIPLFRIKKDKEFVLTDLNKNVFAGKTLMNLTAAHFKGSELVFTILGIKNNDFKKDFNYQFPQYKKSILNEAGAIRPGMSGSPLFNGKDTFPIGMNLKTKVNDHISLVLPTEEFLPLLPDLEKGRDPWKSEHPYYDIGFFHQLDPSQKILQRFRQLVIRDSQGKVIERYTEPCHFGSMVETTTWTQVNQLLNPNTFSEQSAPANQLNKLNNNFDWNEYFKKETTQKVRPIGKNWTESGTKNQVAGGGGSWGDSGGGLNGKASSETLYTDDNNDTAADTVSGNNVEQLLKKLMFAGDAQYFLSKNICRKEGLLVETFPKSQQENRILLASKLRFKDGSLYSVKMDDLESLLLVIRGEEKLAGAGNFGKYSSTNRIYKGDETASLRLICNRDLLGKNLKAFGNLVDDDEKQTLIPSRPWNDFDVKRLFQQQGNAHMLLMREKKYLSKTQENPVVFLECDSDGKSMEIVSENSDWSYRFTVENGKLSGRFSISNIDSTYEINGNGSSEDHLFSYIAEDAEQGFKIQVVLNPINDPLVAIRFIDIPKQEKLRHSFGYNNSKPSLEYLESLWYVKE